MRYREEVGEDKALLATTPKDVDSIGPSVVVQVEVVKGFQAYFHVVFELPTELLRCIALLTVE